MSTRLLVGVVALAVVVWLAAAGAHVTVGTGPSPAPTPAAYQPSTGANVIPPPMPAPDPFAPARWAAANVAVIALLLAIGIGVPVGIALHAWHRGRLAELDHPPLRRPEFVHRAFDVKALEARRGWLPESFTYSPHMRNDVAEVEEAPAPALPLSGSIEELLGHGRGLAYGWRVDNGELLVDRQVRSLLVGGVQGSGKTSFVALLVAQLVRMNARVMLADPDALNEQGLAYRLTGLGIQPEQTAHEPAAVLGLIEDARHELMTRKGQGPHADRRPYVLCVDELPECLRVLNGRDTARLRDALELIGFSGRKHMVSVMMLGQSWSKTVVGSTAVRNLITSSAVFRMRSDEAFYMTNLKSHYWRTAGPDTLDLEPGMFYAVGIDSGAVLARVPKLPDPTRGPARESHFPPLPGHLPPTSPPLPLPSREVGTSGNGSRHFPPPAAAREAAILALVRQAVPVSEIVRQVYGVKGGNAFQRASQEVMAIISRALPPGEES